MSVFPCNWFRAIRKSPTTDLEGNPRPNPAGTNPDIGAYETFLVSRYLSMEMLQ